MLKYYLMDYSKYLNKEQLEAVSTKSQFTRIIAGAGSGKTRVLTYRIAYLISECHVDPSEILAIAFTNKVANEMKERVIKLLPDVSSFLKISTFHSFGARFLRSEIYHLGFSPSFTIFDDDDTERLIREICVGRGYSKKDEIVKMSMHYIANKKCKGQYPSDVKLSNFINEEECLEIFKEYEARKDKMIALDFDDLLLKSIIVLEQFPDVREKWLHKIRYILIDEFQDTNDVQFTLVKLLSDNGTNIYVVGDPDQTIYTWRGANQNIILNFERTYIGAKTIILNRNYRSTKTILSAANKLISNNKKRVPKDLFTENIYGDKIELFKSATKEIEAQHVCTQIKRLINNHEVNSLRDIAVLYRSAYLTLPLEKELVKEHIKYRVFGGVRFYQRKEIKDALAYFRLISNSKDDVSFIRIINVPRRKIGEKSVETLKNECRAHDSCIFDYIKNIENYDTALLPNVVASLSSLVLKILETRQKLLDNDEIYSKILEDFLIDIGYYNYLDLDDDAEERKDNLKTLFDDMFNFIKKNPEDGFQTWLENCTLATSQDDMIDDNYVSLMTVHTAKGLEFNRVFIIGLAESIFPNQRALEEDGRDGLEEERRLAYVAFTRAKQKLYLSMNNGYSFILEGNPVESRFIKEAGLKMPDMLRFSNRENYPRIKIFHDDFSNYFSDDEPQRIHSNIQLTEPIKTNGVTDWAIGDKVMHDKFGSGTVISIIDKTAIVVDFDECGRKTMMASHYMLKRISRLEDMN